MQGNIPYPAREALRLVEKYSTRDPFRIAREEGIKLVPVPLARFYGAGLTLNGYKIIEYSSLIEDEEEQKLAVAHEMGHLYLHPDLSCVYIYRHTLYYNKFEYQANVFAAAMRLGEYFPAYQSLVLDLASKPPEKFIKAMSAEAKILAYIE